jgi:hypothetical protein
MWESISLGFSILLKCMAGIFVVILLIMVCVIILNKFSKNS